MARPKLSLTDMQLLVADAERRMKPMYEFWRFLEGLRRTGAERPLTAGDLQPWVPIVNKAYLDRVNLALGHTTIIAANCVARDPSLIVEAVGSGAVGMSIADDGSLIGSEELELNSKFAQATLAYFWKRSRSTHPLRDATDDMVNLGNGFLTAGWAFVASEVRDDDAAEVLVAIDEAAAGRDDALPELDELAAHFPLTSELVEVDEPYTEYVSPYDILVPATARRMESTPWVVRRMVQPVEFLRSVPEFSHTDAIQANATSVGFSDAAELDRSGSDTSRVFDYAVVYQFWNMTERRLVVFQDGAEQPLYDGENPYLMARPPFVHLRNYNDGGNTFWAFGDLENMVGPQLMFNGAIMAQFDEMDKAGNHYFIHKKLMTPEVRKGLEKKDAIIPIDLPANMDINQVLVPVQRHATPADIYQMEGKLAEYMRQVPGLSDFQVGENGASRMAATAVAAVEGSTTMRAQDKVATVEQAAADLGEMILSLCQQFLDADRAVRIAGPGGAAWLAVRPSDIYGEFRVRTEGGSTRAINPATLAQRGQTIATIILPMLAQIAEQPHLWPAARQAIRDMGLDADHLMSGLVSQQPEPAAEQPADPAADPFGAPLPPQSAPLGPEDLGMSPGLADASMSALMQLNAQSSALEGEPVHPADALTALGAPPVPAATTGDLYL